jgi:hypothetical protein
VLLLLLPFIGLGMFIVRDVGWSGLLLVAAILGGVLGCEVLGAWLLHTNLPR